MSASCIGTAVNAVCLEQCSLGCRGTTCEVTEIAQNENIVLVFSQAIDPRTVNTSTIQLRTASGDVPVGQFLVNGAVVEFRPDILVVGGQSFFGFRAGETYTMTIPGGVGETNSLRSTAGDPMLETIRCTLNVSRGIVDLNGVPPRATLVQPTATTNVPQDAYIQLEFNEIIDSAPFQGATGATGPIQFSVRRTLEQNGVRVCIEAEPVPLGGAPRLDNDLARGRSIVTFRPTSLLPGNACVQVTVTDRVRDLSGRPAQEQIFQFITVPTASVTMDVTEHFITDAMLDRSASAGLWANGVGTFGELGGDGRHGTFDVSLASRNLGTTNGITTYEFDTDLTIIPASRTLSGNQIAVTDGRFFFDEMIVPSDARLIFVGSVPPQFTVRGRLQIDGAIEIQGESVPYKDTFLNGENAGQSGGAGGIFAGSGGQGADRCFGTGVQPNFNGRNGGDCRVLAGHAFAGQMAGTGGRGSQLFPLSGLDADVIAGYPSLTVAAFSMLAASGGSGGGLFQAGGAGRVITNPVPDPITSVPPRRDFMGANTPGGLIVPLLPIPAGTKSSMHFLVGGSGGGGGGSHPAFNITFVSTRWVPGCGGGGGGGAIALRAGDLLRIDDTARVQAQGGSAGVSPSLPAATAKAAPGGGGSGGTILLQSGRVADILGTVDVRGGSRGILARSSPPVTNPVLGGFLETQGGDGSPGLVRLELPTAPLPSALPGAMPAAGSSNVGQLTEQDDRSGFMSEFYNTEQAFGPEFVRYEIEAVVDGVNVTFSDDPSVGTPARFGLAPIDALWQGGTMDQNTLQVDLNNLAEWRTAVGAFSNDPSLATDARNAFRFLIVIDHTTGAQVQIESVKVVFRV